MKLGARRSRALWEACLVCLHTVWNVREQHLSRLPAVIHRPKPADEVSPMQWNGTGVGASTTTRTRTLRNGTTTIVVPQDCLHDVVV
ncbi:hypothetical protein PF008_g21862 [Phytophthora fragariae]|uniref:Uncharacterized protein n=1 Tax=Phytophthora fragariae TaxID=53985 RepID=A0A6G0QVI9_9STRA|nr:hypothetical protein PF008_g21862 [Phytophthora fragariae]